MSSAARDQGSLRTWWTRIPGAFKAAVLLGIVAWFVAISGYSTTTVNDRLTSCSYVDYAKIGLGAIVVLLAATGLLTNRRARRPLPVWIAVAVALLLAADGVLLFLDGLDVVYPVCH